MLFRSRYKPTQVAVEWPAKDQATLDKMYNDYLHGKYVLSRSERDQIGLRLAAKLRLSRVAAVDWNDPPADASKTDFVAWGRAHGFSKRLDSIFDPKALPIPALGQKTISQWLLDANQPDMLAKMHKIYFDIAQIDRKSVV